MTRRTFHTCLGPVVLVRQPGGHWEGQVDGRRVLFVAGFSPRRWTAYEVGAGEPLVPPQEALTDVISLVARRIVRERQSKEP